MKTLLWITTAVVMLHTSYPYILLTANMEDVHALAKQMATSPVVNEIGKIWRRASHQFRREVARDTRRHGDRHAGDSDDDEDSNETDGDRDTRRIVKNIIAFAKNAGYLGPIKRAMEIIEPKLKIN